VAFDDMLQRIKEAWPQERVELSKKRIRSVWNRKLPGDRIPFVFERIPDENGVNVEILESFGYSKDVNLYFQLYQLEKRAMLNDDYIPSLYAGYRQNMIPSGFGAAEIIKQNATQYWSKPLIKIIEDISQLPEFRIDRKDSTLSLLLENIKYFRQQTRGYLPIHLSDSQDAMANASTLMDVNDYFLAMYSNPSQVHALHKLCNNAIIQFIDAQIEAAQGDYIGMNTFWFNWIPPEEGLSLSIDLLAMVSPENVKEFVLPYLDVLAGRYKKILLHSCGNWTHNMDAVKRAKGLKGIDFGVTESSLEEAIEIFGKNSVMFALHNSYVAVYPLKVQSQEEYIKKIAVAIKKYNIPAVVQIFMPPEYTLRQAIKLNELALKSFTF
jgi:hypothetical protein